MDPLSDEVVHIIGQDVQVGPLRRQRCAWCGQLLADDDLSRMAWQLNPDGTDPGPPGMWPVGELLAVTGDAGSFRAMRTVPLEEWPDSEEHPGRKRLPDNCCAMLDPAVTR